MSKSLPYAKLAAVWDLIGQDQHSIKMVEYTDMIFKRFGITPTTGLDLCCGTGTAISLLLDRGYIMSGLDGSSPMLASAAKKLKGRGVKLYHKTLPRFRLLSTVDSRQSMAYDFVTCFYDSLNYITSERDLGATFRSVGNHLNKGGWFIFDMNTPAALKNVWGSQVHAEARRDDIAWVWKNSYNPRTTSALLQTTTFVKEGAHWRRIDEDHLERGYSNTTIKRLLREAGFVIKGYYSCHTFEPPQRDSFRICAVARRK